MEDPGAQRFLDMDPDAPRRRFLRNRPISPETDLAQPSHIRSHERIAMPALRWVACTAMGAPAVLYNYEVRSLADLNFSSPCPDHGTTCPASRATWCARCT